MLRDQRGNGTGPAPGGAPAAFASRGTAVPDRAGLPASGTGADASWLAAALEAVPRAIRALPLLEQRLVIGRYYEGRPMEELERELRLSPARAAALLADALGIIRREVGG